MKRLFTTLICAMALLGCEKAEQNETSSSNKVTFSSAIQTKATDTQFELGDQIYVTAYADGEECYSNICYTFGSNEVFNASTTSIQKEEGAELSYTALYPVADDGSTFTVQSDQSASGNYTLSDLMSSQLSATSSTQPTLTFDHLLTKITLDITSDVELTGATITAMGSVTYNTQSNSVTTQSTKGTITMRPLTTGNYDAIIAPQAMNELEIIVTDVNSVTYTITYSSATETLSGYVYTATITIEEEKVIIEGVDYSSDVNDWKEGEVLGDSSEYIKIYTAEELYNVRDNLAANYEVMNDIDLSGYSNWTPIGSYTSSSDNAPFTGTFDGGGYTISNLTIDNSSEESGSYQGLFGYVSGGTISNLIIKDANIKVFSNVGAVCGYATSSTTIDNCGVEGGSVSGSYYFVGGVVGYAYSSSSVTSCYNTGEVSGSGDYVGGVVGSTNSTVTSCYNTGKVSGSINVGGVVGRTTYTVTSCYNTGEVSGSSSNVGGVVGYAYYYSSTVTSCYNTGKVSGSSSCVGGVVGYAQSSTVTSCYNTGEVSGGGNSVGGVVGGTTSSSTVTSCYNTGEVSGSGDYVGGVIGYASSSSSSSSTVTSCYFIDRADDDANYGVGTDTSSSYDYMKLTSVSELNAVVTTLNAAANTALETTAVAYFTAGSPSTTNLPYLFDENLLYK